MIIDKNLKYFTDYVRDGDMDKFGNLLVEQDKDYYEFISASGMYNLWYHSYRQAYKAMTHGGLIPKAGENKEYDVLFVNHYRNFLQHIHTLTIGQRPAFQCKAENTDVKAQEQSITGNAVINYYWKDKDGEKSAIQTEWFSQLYGAGFSELVWSFNEGEIYDVEKTVNDDGEEEEHPIYEGDARFYTYSPADVIFDYTYQNFDSLDWIKTRRYVNKYKLIKQFPDYEDKILNLPVNDNWNSRSFLEQSTWARRTDLVPVYTLYHKDNILCPGGMIAQYCSADVVFFATALPFDEIPVYRKSNGDWLGTPFSYTVAFDLLPLQAQYNRVRTHLASRHSTLGGTTFVAEETSNVRIKDLAEGMNLVTHKPGTAPPTILNKLPPDNELISAIGMLNQEYTSLSGIPDLLRGHPESSLKSGLALSVMTARAVEFQSPSIAAYTKYLETFATGLIQILKKYSNTERIASIVGENSKYQLKSWTKEDINGISLVHVEMGNPMTNTLSGVLNILEMLLQSGVKMEVSKLVEVLQTSNLNVMTEDLENEDILITEENERLRNGTPCVVLATDDAIKHIKAHLSILYNPDTREDPIITTAIYDHCIEHLNNLSNPNVVFQSFLQLMGIQSLGLPQFPPLEVMQANQNAATSPIGNMVMPNQQSDQAKAAQSMERAQKQTANVGMNGNIKK